MGAAFLCGQAEIVERTIDNSAAYLKGWLEQLRNDKTLIVQAAAQAQKAADFILGNGAEDTSVTATVKTTPPPLAEVRMKTIHPKEFKVMALRDCPVPSDMLVCETPQQIVDYWRLHIATAPYLQPGMRMFGGVAC